MYEFTNEDVAAADGGFWIKADGSVIPIRYYAGHIHALVALNIRGFHRYVHAYRAGWIRVSNHHNEDVSFDLDPTHVSVDALVTLRKLLKHSYIQNIRPFYYLALKSTEGDYDETEKFTDYRDEAGLKKLDGIFRTLRLKRATEDRVREAEFKAPRDERQVELRV